MPTVADYKAPYPAPTADQKRYAIFLDPKGEEAELENYKVQLIPGRIEAVDGINRVFVTGKISEKTVQGWGYDYYVVSLGPTASTLMAFSEGPSSKTLQFVGMNNDQLIRYNSKLPIVVITPKDCVLKYKIWTCNGDGNGGAEGLEAKEG